MVSAVLRKTVRSPSEFYDWALRYGSTEYGDFMRRPVCQSAVHVDPGTGAEYAVLCAQLWLDDLGDLSQPVPEHLQALPGKPPFSATLEPFKGSAQPLFRLPQMPSSGAGSPGQRQNFHHLPPVQGKIHSENLINVSAVLLSQNGAFFVFLLPEAGTWADTADLHSGRGPHPNQEVGFGLCYPDLSAGFPQSEQPRAVGITVRGWRFSTEYQSRSPSGGTGPACQPALPG